MPISVAIGSSGYERKLLNFEKEAHLNRSEKAKPAASSGLKNRFFVRFNSEFGVMACKQLASTGRPTPQTHHQARLAQTDSKGLISYWLCILAGGNTKAKAKCCRLETGIACDDVMSG